MSHGPAREAPTLLYELKLSIWEGFFQPAEGGRMHLGRCRGCRTIDYYTPPVAFEAENPIHTDFAPSMLAYSLCRTSVFLEWSADFPEVRSHPIILRKRGGKWFDADPYVQIDLDVTINGDPTLPRFLNFPVCPVCGHMDIGETRNIERFKESYCDGNIWDIRNAIARKDSLLGRDFAFFRRMMVCTEKGRAYVESKGWSNIKAVPYGTLV